MTTSSMNELGFYTLAGAPESPRDLIAEVQMAETPWPGRMFHIRAVQYKRDRDPLGRRWRHLKQNRDCNRRDQSKHSSPNGDCLVC